MSAFTPLSSNESNKHVNVIIVDDSVVIRGSIDRLISVDPSIHVVATCNDGGAAIKAAEQHKPDVMILDIEMPVMDGLTALPKILEVSPDTKVVMFSSLTEKGASHTLKAFSLGAVECIGKPSSSEDTGPGSAFQDKLISTIKGLSVSAEPDMSVVSEAVPSVPKSVTYNPNADVELYDDSLSYKGKPAIIAIGSSTGGPQALFEVIKNFQGFDVPIVLTQHMPGTFTKILAEHIQQQTGMTTFEGEEGMVVKAGTVYVAPGGAHMKLERQGVDVVIRLDHESPPENFCKPAVDPMFRSVNKLYGQKAVGVILTGMGYDGLKGGEVFVKSGARLIAQDAKTSVVWGMPGAVAQAGLCSAVLPLDQIGPWVRRAMLM